MAVELFTVGSGQRRLGLKADLDRRKNLLGDRSACVPFIHPTRLREIVERVRLLLGDAQNGEVGKHLTNRDVHAHRPPLAPCRQCPRHAAGTRLEDPHILDLHPRLIGIGSAHGASAEFLAGLGDPRESAHRCELRVEPVGELQEVGDVAGRIITLIVTERSPQPVGETVTLRCRHLQLALQQRHQRRCAVAEESGRELRVVEPLGNAAAGMGEHVEILLSSVQNRQPRRLEQPSHRSEIDCHRIDDRDLVLRRELDEGQLGEVRALAMELGVECVPRLAAQPIDQRFELRLRVDPGVGHAG